MIAPLSMAHPRFSMALEMLALLSVTPAPKVCLAADLGLRTAHDLSPLRHEARARLGVPIACHVVNGRRAYRLTREAAARAAELATAYLDDVYGRQLGAAA